MGLICRNATAQRGAELAVEAETKSKGGRSVAIFSAVALALSVYSLWESSLKPAELARFRSDARARSHLSVNRSYEARAFHTGTLPLYA